MDRILDELHAPLLPILRHVLELASLPRTGLALDLACGPGRKAALLGATLGPGVRLFGIDRSLAAIRVASGVHHGTAIEDGSAGSATARSALLGSRLTGIVGDALALPLRSHCCDAAFCIAALGLFADQRAALREMWRVLRPGAPALLVAAAYLWAQVVPWPADIAAGLAAAYDRALSAGIAPIPAIPDLAGDLTELLAGSGFALPLVRAFRIDRAHRADGSPVQHPLAAELPLLPWHSLRQLLSGRVDGQLLRSADRVAAEVDLEACELALVAFVRADA